MEGEDLEVGGGGGDVINCLLVGAGFGAGLLTGERLLERGGGLDGELFPPPPPHLNLLQSTGRAVSEEHCWDDL